MPAPELVKEAARQLALCNACRYCEGYCAVFPAIERRRVFAGEDVIQLANLCFDCRACFNACQFAPPHEFAINLPQALAAVRVETYAEYASPSLLSRLFGGRLALVWLTVALCVALVFGGVLLIQGSDVLFGEPAEDESFYKVVPYLAMMLPALALSAYWVGVFILGAVRFWRATGASLGELFDAPSFMKATKDAFGLEYLKGGGEGCDYPTPEKSMSRAVMHHLLVWGVLLDFASTTLAAIYHHFLDKDAPYAYLSPPVILGAAGGVLILAGGIGLIVLKRRSDKQPASPRMLRLDYAFLVLLIVTSASGLTLLILRDTAAMGTLLTLHLGIVAALYLTLPYSKFAHAIYRYAALIQNHIELHKEAIAQQASR